MLLSWIVVVSLILGSHLPEGGEATSVQANRIADFMNRFGVVTFSSLTNASNTGSDYSPTSVIAAWEFLTGGASTGLKMNYREYHSAGNTAVQEIWIPQLYQATGGKFAVCLAAFATASDVPSLIDLAYNSSTTTGYIEFLEGCNEPNSFSVSESQTMAAQAALNTGVQGLSGTTYPPKLALPSIAVLSTPITTQQENFYGATDLATINNQATYSNAHIYPQIEPDLPSDGNNNGTLADFYDSFNIVYNNKPQIITEWHPTLYASDPSIVTNSTYQSYWTPLFMLRAYLLGYERFYWYALFDYTTLYFCGLFPHSGNDTPRQVAQVVRAMYTLTTDTGSDQSTFATGSLDYEITGLPGPAVPNALNSGGQHLLFQNSSGTFFLYVWNAQQNPGGSGSPVTVTFNTPIKSTQFYRISDSSSPSGPTTPLTPTSSNSSSITWSLDANVYMIVANSQSAQSSDAATLPNGISHLLRLLIIPLLHIFKI